MYFSTFNSEYSATAPRISCTSFRRSKVTGNDQQNDQHIEGWHTARCFKAFSVKDTTPGFSEPHTDR